jgi:hypothetical protein
MEFAAGLTYLPRGPGPDACTGCISNTHAVKLRKHACENLKGGDAHALPFKLSGDPWQACTPKQRRGPFNVPNFDVHPCCSIRARLAHMGVS